MTEVACEARQDHFNVIQSTTQFQVVHHHLRHFANKTGLAWYTLVLFLQEN